MKHQALLTSREKSKKLKCRLLQFLFGALRVKADINSGVDSQQNVKYKSCYIAYKENRLKQFAGKESNTRGLAKTASKIVFGE